MYLKKRIAILIYITIFLFSLVILKVGYIQTFQKNKIDKLAYDMWSRDIPIEGIRGNIYDKYGRLIVGNKLVLSLASINSQIESIDIAAKRISEILECDINIIYKHLKKKNSVELIKPVGRKIDVDKALKIIELDLKGIYVVGDYKRYYPYNDVLCHTLGVVGYDNQGLSGLEYVYDDYLKGENGELEIFTDALGGIIQGMSSNYKSSKKGNDLYLTIDIEAQLALENIIDINVDKYNPTDIAILSTDCNTGEILGIANYPRFEIENYKNYIDILNKNLCIFKSFEPGSVFKILTYSMGLEENKFDLTDNFYCMGHSVINNVKIKDWKNGGHGNGNFLNVIENSCNPGFIEISKRLGIDLFYDYLKKFKLGEKTNVDLTGETKGIIFNKSKMTELELATSSFGQGNSTNMLQLQMACNSCLNGGYLYKPYVVKRIEGTKKFINEKTLINKTISLDTSKKLRYALESVTTRGTGRSSYIEGYRIGGKTGTSQIALNGKYLNNEYILSFMGFSPINDPKVSIYVSIENPKNTIQYGGVVAAPIARECLINLINIFDIKKDNSPIEYLRRYGIDEEYVLVDNYIGLDKSKINKLYGINYLYIGDGNKVISQSPNSDEKIRIGDTIILYFN